MERRALIDALAGMLAHERNLPRLADLFRDPSAPPEELALRAAEEVATDRAQEWIEGNLGWIRVLEIEWMVDYGDWPDDRTPCLVVALDGGEPGFPLDPARAACVGHEKGFDRRMSAGLWKRNLVSSWITEDGRALRVMTETVVHEGAWHSVNRILRSRPWDLSLMDREGLFPPLFRNFWDLPKGKGRVMPEGRFDFSEAGPRRW